MARNKGGGPGFDLWRIGLSLLVILTHSFPISYGEADFLVSGATAPIFASILPIFFALSGFLVTGSALRTRSVRVFLTFRILRIVPALMTEVTLAALVLGPLLTTLPLGEYFSDPRFHVYFGNIVGWIHYALPGVFENNPRPGMVNQNLWTLDPELFCYAAMAALMVTRLVYSRWLMTAGWLAGTAVLLGANMWMGLYEVNGTFKGPTLLYYFLSGVVAYHWRDHIPVNRWLFAVAAAGAYGLFLLPHHVFIVPVLLIYVMIYIGMQKMPRIAIFSRGDYSYGLYLYAYPIQQTLALLFPAIREWYWNFGLGTLAALAVAMASWHLVEKPALSLKRFVRGRPAPIASATEPA